MELYEKSAAELRDIIDSGQACPSEVLESFIGRIEKTDSIVNAFLTYDFDNARKKAKELDSRAKDPGHSALWGIPYALKDNICTDGLRTTCSSKMLENFVPTYSAYVYDRLRNEDAVLLGKADMDEFAMGSTNETSALGSVKNPFDTDKVPGGSSGGAAAAVSAGMAAFALGSDTGGSVRNPAAYCGITGFKPTYGTVSRYGVVSYASSLDQVGTLTGSIEDAAYVMNAVSGYDKRDSTSLNIKKADYTSFLDRDISGLKIGVDRASAEEGLHSDVLAVYNDTIETFRKLGAQIIDTNFRLSKYVIPVYYLIASAEASSNLAKFDGTLFGLRQEAASAEETVLKSRSEGFGSEVKRRIMLGTYALSAGYYDMYYNKALKVRRLIKDDFYSVLNSCDVFFCPTTPTPAFNIGEKIEDYMSLYLADIFTVTANLTGVPAVSFPAGFSSDNLPAGMQLYAKGLNEEAIFRAVYSFQKETDFHLRKPQIKQKG